MKSNKLLQKCQNKLVVLNNVNTCNVLWLRPTTAVMVAGVTVKQKETISQESYSLKAIASETGGGTFENDDAVCFII